jgi:HPt (histidine-containing phosphotransfer) domain-containing protein
MTTTPEPEGPLDPKRLVSLRAFGVYLDEIVKVFVTEAPGHLDGIIRATDASDAGEVLIAAHRLAGSASVFGAARFVGLVRTVERAAEDGSVPDEGTLGAVRDGLQVVLRAVEALSPSGNQPPAGP